MIYTAIVSGGYVFTGPSGVGTDGQYVRNNGSGGWTLATIAASEIGSGTLAVARGGTGLGASPTGGQLLVGLDSGAYTQSYLTASTGVSITNGNGTITLRTDDTAIQHASLAGLLTGDPHTQYAALAPATSTRNTIQPGNATSPNLILKMASGQTVAPLRVTSSSGTLLLSVGTQGQIISALATGTAPLSVQSTTLVTNLNANYLAGNTAGDFAGADHVQAVTNGGTGLTSVATGDIFYASGSNVIATLGKPTMANAFFGMSTAGVPLWSTVGGGTSTYSTAAMSFMPQQLQAVETNFATLELISGTSAKMLVRAFDDTTEEYANFCLICPANTNASGSVSFTAMTQMKSATSGNLQLTMGVGKYTSGQTWDQPYTELDSGTVAVAASTLTATAVTWGTTASSLGFNPNAEIHLRISRDPSVSGDPTGDMYLRGLLVTIPVS